MSYDIYIGNAEIEYDDVVRDSEMDDCRYEVHVRVNHVTSPNAPVFVNDEMTGNGNSRHPGYVQWSGALRAAGIYDLFFDENTGLMRRHPGCFPLVKNDLEVVQKARDEYVKKYPNASPRFGTWDTPGSEEDAVLARLEWLVFWIAWALENCEHPAIYNH